jgi:cell division protein ZapA (FtsZ GTPase activity inhibitor)
MEAPDHQPADMALSPVKRTLLVGLLLLVVVITAYAPSLDLYFRGDDFDWLNYSFSVHERPLALLERMFLFFRPLVTLSLYLSYLLFGSDPVGFNLVTIALHVINVALVHILIYRLTGRIGPAAATAILYGTSPLLVEVSLWSAARNDSILLIFFLLALLILSGKNQQLLTNTRRQTALLLVYLGALGTKESWLMLPAVCLALVLLHGRLRVKQALLVTASGFVLAAGYVLIFFVGPMLSKGSSPFDYTAAGQTDVFAMVGKLGFLVLHYLRLEDLFPAGVWQAPLGLLLLLAILLVAASSRNRLALFGLAFMILTMLPTISIALNPSRFNYLPLLGFWIAAVALVDQGVQVLAQRSPGLGRKAAVVIAALVLAVTAFQVHRLQGEIADYRLYGELHRQLADLYEQIEEEIPTGRPFLFVDLGARNAAVEFQRLATGYRKVINPKVGGLWEIAYLDDLANVLGRPFERRMQRLPDEAVRSPNLLSDRALVFTDHSFRFSRQELEGLERFYKENGRLPPVAGVYQVTEVNDR